VSRNGARWLRAKVRSSPSTVMCRLFQVPPDVDQHINPGKAVEHLVSEPPQLDALTRSIPTTAANFPA